MAYEPNNLNGNAPAPQRTIMDRVNINPARLIRTLMSRWYWILAAMLIAGVIGFIYAKSKPVEFLSTAILQYDSKSKEAKFSTNSLLGPAGSDNAEYMAEVYRLKSIGVIDDALDSLQAQFFFYKPNGLRKENLYPHRPFDADILSYEIEKYGGGEFKLLKNGNSFNIRYKEKRGGRDTTFENVTEGSIVQLPGLSFRLKSKIFTQSDDVSFHFIDYWTKRDIAGRVLVAEAERNLPVLRANFQSDNAAFTRDFLATLISSYSLFDLETKRSSSEHTLRFINDQLQAFEALMRASSSKLENIKSRYDLLDVDATSNQYMSSVSDLRTRKLNLEIQGSNFDLVTEDIKKNKEVVANVIGWDGAPDPFLNNMLQELNDAYRRRKQNLINYSPESIVIKNIDDEISQLKAKIIENVSLQKKKSEQAYKAYDRQLAELNRDLARMPAAERDLIYTTSDVDVNKNIYTLLLNKKLETDIDKSGQSPSFIVIDRPEVAVHTGPNEKLIIVIALLSGIFLGVIFIFLRRAFNTRFANPELLENIPGVSLIGLVRHTKLSKAEQEIFGGSTDELFVEDINLIRANLMFQQNTTAANVISLTSGKKGEGKTFLSVSLAASFARLGRSVLLIEADLRDPDFNRFFETDQKKGLVECMEKPGDLEKCTYATGISGLDYMPAGINTPGMHEALHSESFISCIQFLKDKYDIIVIDTAPVGLVSDAIPVLKISDTALFVVRWLYSQKNAVSVPAFLSRKFDLKNISVVINDFKKDELYSSLEESSESFETMYSTSGNYGSQDASLKKKQGK